MTAERGIYNLLAEYCADFDAGAFDRFAKHFEQGTWFPTAAEGTGVRISVRGIQRSIGRSTVGTGPML
jgi:hypothetical protein